MSNPSNHHLTKEEMSLFTELHNEKLQDHETFKKYPGDWI